MANTKNKEEKITELFDKKSEINKPSVSGTDLIDRIFDENEEQFPLVFDNQNYKIIKVPTKKNYTFYFDKQLEVDTTTGAILVPRMTTTQKNALTGVNGMVVYDSTLNLFQFYVNGSWVGTGSGATGTVYLSADQANTGTLAKVNFDTELFATTGITWDVANHRFTATVAGNYLVTAIVYWTTAVANKSYTSVIKKTGNSAGYAQAQGATTTDISSPIHRIVALGVGDYIELWAAHSDGANSHNIGGTAIFSYMSIAKV